MGITAHLVNLRKRSRKGSANRDADLTCTRKMASVFRTVEIRFISMLGTILAFIVRSSACSALLMNMALQNALYAPHLSFMTTALALQIAQA